MLSKEKNVCRGSDYYIYTPSAMAKEFFLYPTVIGNFRYEAGYRLCRESYDSFLCMYITDGSCRIETQTGSYTARKDDIVLIDCYKPHSYGSEEKWEAEWFHFDGMLAGKYYETITESENAVITLNSSYRLKKNLDRLYLCFKNNQPINEAVLNNLIINMLTELIVSRQQPRDTQFTNDIIEDVIAYITENLDRELSVKELSEKANLSPFYFSRLFKKETGFAPYDYVLTSRINHAKYLLLNTNMSSKDICFQLGFNSESSFCTAFRKKTGYSPKAFRT